MSNILAYHFNSCFQTSFAIIYILLFIINIIFAVFLKFGTNSEQTLKPFNQPRKTICHWSKSKKQNKTKTKIPTPYLKKDHNPPFQGRISSDWLKEIRWGGTEEACPRVTPRPRFEGWCSPSQMGLIMGNHPHTGWGKSSWPSQEIGFSNSALLLTSLWPGKVTEPL